MIVLDVLQSDRIRGIVNVLLAFLDPLVRRPLWVRKQEIFSLQYHIWHSVNNCMTDGAQCFNGGV